MCLCCFILLVTGIYLLRFKYYFYVLQVYNIDFGSGCLSLLLAFYQLLVYIFSLIRINALEFYKFNGNIQIYHIKSVYGFESFLLQKFCIFFRHDFVIYIIGGFCNYLFHIYKKICCLFTMIYYRNKFIY